MNVSLQLTLKSDKNNMLSVTDKGACSNQLNFQ